MELVLDEPETAHRLRQAAQRRAGLLFDLEKMIASHRDLYARLCSQERRC